MAILKFRDAEGNVQEILAIKGDKGDDYVLTDTDKQEIAQTVDVPDTQVLASVQSYLDAHPEATTTVADGAVTFTKLNDDVAEKIKNHIADPAFEDIADSNKVQFVYVNTKSVSDGVLTFGKTSSGQFRAQIKGSGSYVKGHVYYCDIQVKIDSPTTTNASTFSVLVPPNNTIELKLVEDWQRACSTFIPTSVETEYIRVYRTDADTDPATCHVKTPVLVDLTEVFGEGNEPSAEEFKVMFDQLRNPDTVTYGVFKDRYTINDIDSRIKLYGTNELTTGYINWDGKFGENPITLTGNGNTTLLHTQFPVSIPDGAGKCHAEKGDFLYWACSVRFEDDDCIKLGIDITSDMSKDSTRYGVYVDNPAKETWHRLSMVYPMGGIHYPSMGVIYPDAETQNGKTLQYKCGILLNLTQIFGKGNEPTADVIDACLSSFPNGWFSGTKNIFDASILPKAFARYNNLYDKSGYGAEDGRFVARSIMDKNAEYWNVEKYSYGYAYNNRDNIPIPHEFSGSVKTDSMFISDGQYGAWSTDASGELTYGGHVFHGWNEIGTYRLSLMIGNSCVGGAKREDEAAILVYSPSNCFENPTRELTEEQLANRITPAQEDYYHNNPSLKLGRVRIGSDVHNEGVVFQKKKTTFYGDIIMTGNNRTISSSTAEGAKGTVCYDDNYVYICVADNTWKRFKLETW